MTLADMLPWVLEHAMTCPDFVAERHLVQAVRRWCDITLAWQESADPALSEAGRSAYEIPVWPGSEIVRILRAEFGDRPCVVQGGAFGRSQARHQRGGYAVTQVGALGFEMTPTPQLDGVPIVIDVALRPAFGMTELPDVLTADFDAITKGAAASLLALPAQPWSNPQAAMALGAQFSSAASTRAARVALADKDTAPRGVRFF
jgi:hypothetical protein